MIDSLAIEAKYRTLSRRLDEASLRMWAAVEARSLGRGGIGAVGKATGRSRTTIHAGLAELKEGEATGGERKTRVRSRIRAAGGGRKKLTEKDTGLLDALDALVEPTLRGDPESPLRWTCKSTYRLAEELKQQGRHVSQRSVCDLLAPLGYSLQSTRKTREGGQHEDRDEQFAHMARTVAQYQEEGEPVISVDTKKKELIGEFRNAGREWRPEGKPEEVRGHDFLDAEKGKVSPDGGYDLTADMGGVSVGIDHDTGEFAVESIRRWWREMGEARYPHAPRLLITADCGGSNGYRGRLWRRELQKLADEMKREIQVCHFPPGTRKWNKIEHCMFCHITANWRGRPLVGCQVVVNPIGNTTTREGLRIQAGLDENTYEKGVKVTDEELASLTIERAPFHGEWNARLLPRSQND